MKRLLFGILLMAFVAPALATNLNFQNPTDMSHITNYSAAVWVGTANARNNYIAIGPTNPAWFNNTLAESTTYVAYTKTNAGNPFFDLQDASHNTLYSAGVGNGDGRMEIKMNGGFAYLYRDGTLISTSGALAQNPSFVSIGVNVAYPDARFIDDFVYGTSENKYVLGLPETDNDKFVLLKDQTNPASSGLALGATDAIVDSMYMYGTWARGNSDVPPPATLANESIQLINLLTGTVYATNYTGTSAYYGTVQINVNTSLFSSTAPYGLYVLTIPGSGKYSNAITYRGTGATIAYDNTEYNQQDTATLTYTVEDDYWLPGTYDYRIDIISGTTGVVVHTQSILVQSGTDTYQFTSSDSEGVYYAVLIGKNVGNEDVWFAYDYAELNAYLTFLGYVNDETASTLSGAVVNITQGNTIVNTTSASGGDYTATGFVSGSITTINVTKPGYVQYYASLIPLVSKTIPLNFTLVSSTPTYTGIGIGGVARDGILSGSAITSGYGRPIPDATVFVKNTTNGESYTKTTNNAGYYLCDEGESCFLTDSRPYDIWGEKLRYDNSPNYTAVA